ncbi:MAG: tetratricopeptide repeat protein [Betaproteobacteria bacterium]|nr:tetratricopeptide repeat protein [Betaproteobacteria bacterium]
MNAVAPGLHSAPLELRPLPDAAQAWALFRAGWADMARRLGKTGVSAPIDEVGFTAWLARDSRHAYPLWVLAHALNLLHDPAAVGLSRHEILGALADRERARIEAECRASDEFKDPQGVRGVVVLKALAALPGRLDAASVHTLRTALHGPGAGPSQAGDSPLGGQRSVGAHPTGIALPAAAALRSTSLWQPDGCGGHLPALQPDLLAAHLLYRTLADLLPDDATRGEWLWQTLAQGAGTTAEWQRRLTRLARLSADRAGQAPGDPLIAALSGVLRGHPERARACRPALESDTLDRPLQPLAIAATQCVLAAGGLDPAEEARLLNIVSIRLAESGARRGGLAAIRRAVDIYDGLAAQDLAAWGADLAMSLNNLSVHLGGSGELPGALAAMRRAVEIYERLAAENFAAWGPDLAMGLHNLSIRLADGGERAGGLAAIRRAVEIGERLAAENFAAWAPDLARSLDILSLYLAAGGERPGALAAIRRAVEIQERLAAHDLATHAPDLARSRHILTQLLPQGSEPS